MLSNPNSATNPLNTALAVCWLLSPMAPKNVMSSHTKWLAAPCDKLSAYLVWLSKTWISHPDSYYSSTDKSIFNLVIWLSDTPLLKFKFLLLLKVYVLEQWDVTHSINTIDWDQPGSVYLSFFTDESFEILISVRLM